MPGIRTEAVRARWRRTTLGLISALVLTACSALPTTSTEAKAPVEQEVSAPDDSGSEPAPNPKPAPEVEPDEAEPDEPAPDADPTDVVGCDRKTIGEEAGPLAVAYGVVDGQIAPVPCFGEPSDVVESAWNDLAAITPTELLEGVVIVAGFTDSFDTLAYAVPVDNDSDEHIIALAIDEAINDPAELRLTMAHELTHVFGQTPGQIDVAVFEDECDTFYNGFGCFQPDAYITAWIDQFWDPAAIRTLPADYSVDIEGGEARCLNDASFPGSYAASHPEEDFAESFSAYVFDVDMPASLSARLAFFDQYPEFVAMRDAVRAQAVPSPPNNFDDCG